MKVKDRSKEPWEQTSIVIHKNSVKNSAGIILQEIYINNIRVFSSCNMTREAFNNGYSITFGLKVNE